MGVRLLRGLTPEHAHPVVVLVQHVLQLLHQGLVQQAAGEVGQAVGQLTLTAHDVDAANCGAALPSGSSGPMRKYTLALMVTVRTPGGM